MQTRTLFSTWAFSWGFSAKPKTISKLSKRKTCKRHPRRKRKTFERFKSKFAAERHEKIAAGRRKTNKSKHTIRAEKSNSKT